MSGSGAVEEVAESVGSDGVARSGRVARSGGVARSVDARLARLHLRGGLLALARAELEHMAGADTLDVSALADLAEVRWRNGDLVGAAEAASAHLESGGDEPMAMIICAEALDHDGHLLDARALAARALERVGGQIDRLFAGQPRSGAWSSTGSTQLPLAPGTMTWGGLAGGLEVHQPEPSIWAAAPVAVTDDAQADDAAMPAGSDSSIAERVEISGAAGRELEAIEGAITAQRLNGVPERLALLLRADRALAPLILFQADRALAAVRRDDPIVAGLHLLCGDALRALGRESDATAAFGRSLRAVAARSTDKEPQ